MTTDEMLTYLSSFFLEFNVHPSFLEELANILLKNISDRKRFFRQLVTLLFNIKNFGFMINTVDHHEKIKYTDLSIYSLHLSSSQYNVRFLAYINNEGKCYFLSAFYERNGKRKTDYSSQIAALKSRLEKLLGDDDNE